MAIVKPTSYGRCAAHSYKYPSGWREVTCVLGSQPTRETLSGTGIPLVLSTGGLARPLLVGSSTAPYPRHLMPLPPEGLRFPSLSNKRLSHSASALYREPCG